MNDLEKTILTNLQAFVGFARTKINDPALAADVVQESLLKALQAADPPGVEEKIVPWFSTCRMCSKHGCLDCTCDT